MCTLSLIRLGETGLVLAFNRDEQRSRIAGEAPMMRTCGGVRSIAPRDPEGGGTWIAVNEHGIAMAVLNGNPPPEETVCSLKSRSRGQLVDRAATGRNLDEAIESLIDAAKGVNRPFRWIATDGRELVVATFGLAPHRESIGIGRESWCGDPRVYASSGLGDHLVERPRCDLFDSMVRQAHRDGESEETIRDAQMRFHASTSPLRPELAVLMSRGSARTVSRSEIILEPARRHATFRHRDLEHAPVQSLSPDPASLELLLKDQPQ